MNAPSAEDTFHILMGIRNLYEQHHHITLPDNVLKAAVDYSIQYIPQRSLPDKAIDLLDMTAAHLAAQHPVTDLKTLETEIAKQKESQEKAVAKEDFEKALAAKHGLKHYKSKLSNITKAKMLLLQSMISQSL